MALDEELPEKADDKTLPKYKQIDKRAGSYIYEWAVTLAAEAETHRGTKREMEDEDAAAPAKKRVKAAVAAKALVDMSPEELKRAVAGGAVGKCTVAELKEFCHGNSLAVAGKKAELVERVEEFIEG